MNLMQDVMLISFYVGEVMKAGPDAVTLVRDAVRAMNDFRAGKLTKADFDAVIADITKLAGEILAPTARAA